MNAYENAKKRYYDTMKNMADEYAKSALLYDQTWGKLGQNMQKMDLGYDKKLCRYSETIQR